MREALLCCVGTSSETPAGSIALYDFESLSFLASLGPSSGVQHGTVTYASRLGRAGFVLAAQQQKPLITWYSFQKDTPNNIVLPERVSCVTVDHEGRFCAAGTAQGRVYLWEIASGLLFCAWNAHYRRITTLRFALDGDILLSASEDSAIHAWSMSHLLGNRSQMDSVKPSWTLADHTLSITDIVCGSAAARTRLLSSSLDRTVKVWDLTSRTVLTTYMFPQPIVCLKMDELSRFFFAGTEDGVVYHINLNRRHPGSHRIWEGVSEVVQVDESSHQVRLIHAGGAVTSLAISLNGASLLIGTVNGVNIYDISSHQLLRSLTPQKNGPVTHIETMIRPPDLAGHTASRLSFGRTQSTVDQYPPVVIAPFHRTRDTKRHEMHEVPVMLSNASLPDCLSYEPEEFSRDQAAFRRGSEDMQSEPSLRNKITVLETEIKRLRGQLGRAKGANDTLWETVVQGLSMPVDSIQV